VAGAPVSTVEEVVITFKPATSFDVSHLLKNLRPHDAAEIEATGGITEMKLWECIEGANEAYSVFTEDRELVCIFGINPHPVDQHQGIVWLLGTHLLDRHLKTLCKASTYWLKRWHTKYPVLTNHTDQRNKKVLRWLQWLGFKFINVNPVGPYKVPFIHFIRECYV
jgi:hypothetical protein